MKESEAKTKWCPMTRMSSGTSMAINMFPDGEIPKMCNCIASDCMMWRQNSDGHYCGLAGKP